MHHPSAETTRLAGWLCPAWDTTQRELEITADAQDGEELKSYLKGEAAEFLKSHKEAVTAEKWQCFQVFYFLSEGTENSCSKKQNENKSEFQEIQ